MSAASKACQQLVKHVSAYMYTTAYMYTYVCMTGGALLLYLMRRWCVAAGLLSPYISIDLLLLYCCFTGGFLKVARESLMHR